MMRRMFRHREREVPQLNTSSLPDLIFTVLFFFMIVTHMREVQLQVHYDVPQATEVQQLGHKGSVIHIYVGRLLQQRGDTTMHIQLGNHLGTLDEIPAFISRERSQMSADDQAHLTISLRADRDVPMSLIIDIKEHLRQVNALRVSYATTEAEQLPDSY